MHSTVTQFTKCLFQELWRQFLEEKEGPSEAAAAAPVQVFTLMKISLLGLDIGYWVLGIGHWEAIFKINKFAKKNLCAMKMASQCPLKKIYLSLIELYANRFSRLRALVGSHFQDKLIRKEELEAYTFGFNGLTLEQRGPVT